MIIQNLLYVAVAMLIVFVLSVVNHIFRGVWRLTAAKKIEGVEFTFLEQWKARTFSDFFTRESFGIDDNLLGIELDSEGFYKLDSMRNFIITLCSWIASAVLIVVFVGDKVWPVFTTWIDGLLLSS